MLGILRFFLASCVVVFHFSGSVPTIGILAVNFFYVISGYLMTLVLHETYRFNPVSFFSNRALRLYPAQLAICMVSIPFLWGLSNAQSFHPLWGTAQWQDWIGNILIFPWTFLPSQHFRISPTTWSVAVEICCYFLLWLFVSRRAWTAISSVGLAILWQAYQFHVGADQESHYFPVSAAMLPFSLGAASYFATDMLSRSKSRKHASTVNQLAILISVITVFVVNWRLALRFDASPFYGLFYYVNDILACVSVIILHGKKYHGITKNISLWFGDLSYPVFLCQWLGAFIAWHIIGIGSPMRSWWVFLIGYVIAVGLGVCIVLLVDRPIQALRARVREIALAPRTPLRQSLN